MYVRKGWGPHKDGSLRFLHRGQWPDVDVPHGVNNDDPEYQEGVMFMYRLFFLGDKMAAPVINGEVHHRLYCALERNEQHVWVCSEEDTFAVRMPFTKDFLKVFLGAARMKAINLEGGK